MAITRELVQEVRKRVAENPGLHTAFLASELKASESEIITALPLEMRLRGRNSDFESIRETVAGWENAIVTASGPHGEHCILKGCAGKNQSSAKSAIRNLNAGEVGYTWFLSKPLQGQDTHSVQFFDRTGAHILSVYLGRDKEGVFDPAAKASFDEMRRRFGVKPVPHNRCRGCGKCTCAGQKQQQELQHPAHNAA